MLDLDLALILHRLHSVGKLSSEDSLAMLNMPFVFKEGAACSYLIREGEPQSTCPFILSGFAARQKLMVDGGRSIVSLILPGEAVDFQGLYLDEADHGVIALTAIRYAAVPSAVMRQLLEKRPAIALAVLTDLMVNASILREWIANNSRRDGKSRLAHFLCEFVARMNAQGLGDAAYDLPLTQDQLADALGMTTVHVNRSFRALEDSELLIRNRRRFSFPDIPAIERLAGFNRRYLHVDKHLLLA